MNKLIITFLTVVFSISLHGQIIATVNDNGKKVILNSDGTWKYEGQVENLKTDSTGIWKINYFVDDFGDPTKDGYIAHDYYIKGTFSNSATTNSDLNVFVMISGAGRIGIQLYEYAGKNAVKAYSNETYKIAVKDSNGVKHSLSGLMLEGGNRIYVDLKSGKKQSKMHGILSNEGDITVVITDNEYGLNNYKFKFNADGYNKAFNQLFK